jgi:hypothetical protein
MPTGFSQIPAWFSVDNQGGGIAAAIWVTETRVWWS